MQDKKSFGKYIAEKRKEANLTQEELAKRLFTIPSTISKWERGVTYPDISMITNLCRELDISEHEFFTACDDEAMSKEKREIQKYRAIKKWAFIAINVGYIIGLVACFICSLAIDKRLSWFWIVAIGIAMAFSLTSLPFYLKNNKYKFLKVAFVVTGLTYLLLFVVNQINGTDWLIGGFSIATFVYVFVWTAVLICTFTKIAISYKVSICLLCLAFVTIFANPVCARVLDIERTGSDVPNLVSAGVMVAIALTMSFKQFRSE